MIYKLHHLNISGKKILLFEIFIPHLAISVVLNQV